MNWALIKDGIVVNVIICADQSFIDKIIAPQFDSVVQVANGVRVSPGDSYQNGAFIEAAPVVLDDKTKQIMKIQYAQNLLASIALSTDQQKLTADQKYSLAQSLSGITGLLNTGDLEAVVEVLPKLPLDNKLLNKAAIDGLSDQITSFLKTL